MKILFVCTANMFRSATAHYIMNYLYPDQFEIRSAGTMVQRCGWEGLGMVEAAFNVLTEKLGYVGQSDHRSRSLATEDLKWADLVVCMEERHIKSCRELHSGANCELLDDREVPDLSSDSDRLFFERSYDRILKRCEALRERLSGG